MPTKGPTQIIVETVGAGIQKSVCFFDLRWWSVGCHQLLRSRWHYFPSAVGHLPSVESRIAFTGKTSNSGNGLPMHRCRPDLIQLRSMAIQLLPTAMFAASAQAAAPEIVIISVCDDGDTFRTTDWEWIRLACIDTSELSGKRVDPVPAGAAGDHLCGIVVGRFIELRRITIDRYHRTVDELFFDEIHVQLVMIASGHAEIDWRYADQCSWAS